MSETLSASLENYLRTIYEIVQEREAVRAKDIAERLEVRAASVTGALRALARRGLINYTPYGVITLTPEGRRAGGQIKRTRDTLRDFLVSVLSVEKKSAAEAACRLEHGVSRDVMDRFVKFFEFMTACPNAGFVWEKGVGFHCREHGRRTGCAQCVNPAYDRKRCSARRAEKASR